MEELPKYVTLLLVGLLLIGLETIIPGGILGVFGAIALIWAAVLGFTVFPPPWGFISAIGIVLVAGVTMVLWIRYFPQTPVGRFLTLKADTKTYKAAPSREDLLGKEGSAQSTLRPAGIARIDGKRVDVVAEGNWIERGASIKVIGVEGNRITVREVHPV